MLRSFLACLSMGLIFYCCNNAEDKNDAVTERPPYDKITDSIKAFPSNPELYYHRGSLFYNNNQLIHAEQDLRTAWQLKPSETYALSLTTILKAKHADSAINFLKRAIEKLPQSVALQVGLARGYQQKKQIGEAITICNQILAIYPNQLDALLLKSELLKEEGKTAKALTVMETAYSYAPGDPDIAYELAYFYAEAGSPKTIAFADLLLRTDVTESSAKAFYVKGIYYQGKGDATEAIKNYDAAIRRDYNFLDPYISKGELFYDQKKYDAAMQTFELGLRVAPSTAEFYYLIGKTQEAMGDKANAKLNYLRAYSLDKSMSEAKEAADKL